MNRVVPALALMLVLGFASLATAHVESYNQSESLQAGPYLIFFEPRPTPPFANFTVSLVAQVSDANTGALLQRVPMTAIIAGPSDFSERKAMAPDGTSYHVASMLIPSPGVYSVRLLIEDTRTNETHGVDTEFEVFKDLPFRIRALDQALDVITGVRTPIAFEVIDPLTLDRKDAFQSLDVRAEHWTDDHTTYLGEQDLPATRTAAGTWRIDPTFTDKGMYHLRFASTDGGFTYADVPLLHVYATAAEQTDVKDETPALGVLGILALVGVLALLRRR